MPSNPITDIGLNWCCSQPNKLLLPLTVISVTAFTGNSLVANNFTAAFVAVWRQYIITCPRFKVRSRHVHSRHGEHSGYVCHKTRIWVHRLLYFSQFPCRRDVRAVMLRLPEVVELRRSLAGLLSVKRRFQCTAKEPINRFCRTARFTDACW